MEMPGWFVEAVMPAFTLSVRTVVVEPRTDRRHHGRTRRPGHGDPADASVLDRQFDAFYRAEHDGQVRRAALLLGSDEAAADAVHDAFVAVYRRWGTIAEPGPYLNRCVLNACRDQARTVTRRQRTIARLYDPGDRPANDDVMFDVLSELPFNQRAAVVLRFYAGMTEHEIAEVLECSTGSIGPWIRRALTAMREVLP